MLELDFLYQRLFITGILLSNFSHRVVIPGNPVRITPDTQPLLPSSKNSLLTNGFIGVSSLYGLSQLPWKQVGGTALN
jgi:hypothetical protein